MTMVYGKYRRGRFPRWLLVLLICILVLLLAAGAGIWYVYQTNEYRVELTIFGDTEMTLDYGQVYTEPGAEAYGYGTILKREHTSQPVTISGNVNVEKLGTYTVEYGASFGDASDTVTRTVTIVDREAPVITLTTDPEHFTFPGQPYQEEGYSACDNYDGDLSEYVLVEENDGKVIYTVSDSSGNRTQITRDIYYDDPVPPELTLKGEAQITITEGENWAEPGYTALDNIDGDITGKVTVTGQVIPQTPGTYHLVYQVCDAYENTVKAERTVIVKENPTPLQEEASSSNGEVIYLTFDDGPSRHTPRLLQILEQYDVKATFFVCNTDYVEYLDDIANAGHSLAIHTYSHNYSQIYTSEEAFYEDLYGMQDVIFQHTGIRPAISRFPGGSSNSISKKYCLGIMTQLTQSIQEQGFYYFDWTVDSDDAGSTKTTEGVVQNVINGISGSSRKNHYVLQHDIYGFSVEAVEQIIVWGLENGYSFKAITTESPACHHGVKN